MTKERRHLNGAAIFAMKKNDEFRKHLASIASVHVPVSTGAIIGKRTIPTETNKVTTGTSAAFSSHKALYYHDIAPEFFRRVAKRHTDGHTKYNDNPKPITMNLNWRIGLSDPLYVMDRLNHMFDHMVNFLEHGNIHDDNLGAIGWCVQFLMEAERLHPEVLFQCIGQCHFSGKEAEDRKKALQSENN